jgi:aspartate carbamoyltransferase catalytic subunit
LKNIEALKSDIVIIRHPASEACKFAANVLKASVVNAGDGINEHPTQALLDAFTIIEKKGQIKGLTIIIAGDILHSRVARSNIFLLTKLGADVKIYAPPMMLPREIEELGVKVVKDFKEEIKDADVVMMLRVQLERQNKALFPSVREYAKFFGFKRKYLDYMKEDAIIMHPGPMNRGVEISSEVADSDKSVILEQVENGIAVRMAILYLLIGRSGEIQ